MPDPMIPQPFIAIGVGNSSVQVGRFCAIAAGGVREPTLPQLISREVFPSRMADGRPNEDWEVLRAIAVAADGSNSHPVPWYIASVFCESAELIAAWIKASYPRSPLKLLSNHDFPISIDTESPQQVGTDRIAAATAVARIKAVDRPAIFADAGTALTVNAVSTAGEFLGGAILPGTAISGTALNLSTDQLPKIFVTADKPAPHPIGRATRSAIASGIYWGSVGAVKELMAQMTKALAERNEPNPPQIFVTGGFGSALAEQLGESTECMPHLVLAGIAVAVDTTRP